LKRNARPKDIHEVALCYRGSSVHVDRPRVVLALRRVGDVTEFGIPAPNGVPLHNFLASEVFSDVKRLRRDEPTFRHMPIEYDEEAEKAAVAVDEIQEAVLAAVKRLLAEGERVSKSSRREVFTYRDDPKHDTPELEDMSRAKTREAVNALLAAERLGVDDDGNLMIP
jgi:hypothetical protein